MRSVFINIDWDDTVPRTCAWCEGPLARDQRQRWRSRLHKGIVRSRGPFCSQRCKAESVHAEDPLHAWRLGKLSVAKRTKAPKHRAIDACPHPAGPERDGWIYLAGYRAGREARNRARRHAARLALVTRTG